MSFFCTHCNHQQRELRVDVKNQILQFLESTFYFPSWFLCLGVLFGRHLKQFLGLVQDFEVLGSRNFHACAFQNKIVRRVSIVYTK